MNNSMYVGLDAHSKQITVAVILPGESQVSETWEIAHDKRSLGRLAKRLLMLADGAQVQSAYEAGPCGFALQRRLVGLGIDCMVAAPSLIPVQPGRPVKTDKRDARKLARLLRSDLLTVVHPPTEQEEALRDLVRARVDAKKDLMAARHRLSKFLLRHGHQYGKTKNWTKRYWAWVKGLDLELAHLQEVLHNYIWAIEQIEERIALLDAQIEAASQEEAYKEKAGWLRCLRGVDTITAMTILAELHDFRRFRHPRQLMSYLGLTPSEYSSGGHSKRGSITKAGNTHARRVLIEAAWNYRHRPSVRGQYKQRRAGQPPAVLAIADRAQQRLYQRYHRLKDGYNKPHNVVTTAIARELVGFIWAILNHDPDAPHQP